MSEFITEQILFRSSDFILGEFRCAPRDRGWLRRSVATTHFIAFPRTCSQITQAGRELVVATPNLAVLYNAGCEYTCRILEPERELTTFVSIAERALVEAVSEFDESVADRANSPWNRTMCATSACTHLHHVTLALGAGVADPLELGEHLCLGLRRVLVDAFGAAPARRGGRGPRAAWREQARQAQEVMAGRFRERITLDELGACVGLSPMYLCRVFRAVTGMTVHGYLESLRLRSSIEELADPKRRLVDVALGSGYGSQSHFTTAFGRAFGVSPGRLRGRLAEVRALRRERVSGAQDFERQAIGDR